MRTEVSSCIDPRRPVATRLFFRTCLESSPIRIETGAFRPSVQRTRGGGAQVQLHQLKSRMLEAALKETSDVRLSKRLCGAANEAAELAWAACHPLLVFPCLFEELVQRARTECQLHPEAGPAESGMGADQRSGSLDLMGDIFRREELA
jgi:hypothetical protein